jgi:hypothetical protein
MQLVPEKLKKVAGNTNIPKYITVELLFTKYLLSIISHMVYLQTDNEKIIFTVKI